MKNLLFFLLCVVSVQAQNNKPKLIPSLISDKHYPIDLLFKRPDVKVNPFKNISSRGTMKAPKGMKIGETYYDIQNSGSRIIRRTDNTISAIWNYAGDPTVSGPGFPDISTGYNFFNGTSWGNPALKGVGANRRMNGQLVQLGTKEIIFSESADSALTFRSINNQTGNRSFLEDTCSAGINPSFLKHTTGFKVAASGDTIHVLSIYKDSTDLNNNAIKLNGIYRPVVYSRSTDGGITWDIQGITLPGYDSTEYFYFSRNAYALDAKGKELSIIIGGTGNNINLWKSNDAGSSFQKSNITTIKFPRFDVNAPLNGGLIETNDGTLDVLIDEANRTHVCYPIIYVSRDTVSGEGIWYPGTIGLRYWNEVTAALDTVLIYLTDIAPDSSYEIGLKTLDYSPNGKGGCYGGGLLTMPSMGSDLNGNVFLAFSLPADGDSTNDGQSYRDIFGIRKCSDIFKQCHNMTNTLGIEESFPLIDKKVDFKLHIFFQQDVEPGTIDNGDDPGLNEIRYFKFDTIFLYCPTRIKILNKSVVNVYPNPVNSRARISSSVQDPEGNILQIIDIQGRKVLEKRQESSDGFIIYADELGTGMFFYNLLDSKGNTLGNGKLLVNGSR